VPRPNILFFTCHDLGRHLGCYGRRTVASPALDAFAASGMRFDNVFCTAPQCSPSRASLHTGRYPHAAGVLGLAHEPFGWRLPKTERHLAQILREHGYTTALVGMQHLIAHGQAEELGYQRVLPVAPAMEEAVAAVPLLAELAAGDRPFYLEIGFEEPHRPYDFGGAALDDSLGVEVPSYLPDGPEARQDFAAFQGAIRVLDRSVGHILAGLNELGLADETWVIFTADHGAAMPRAKGTLYDPGIAVTLLMRHPAAGIGPGRVSDELLSNVDMVPTLLEALDLPLPGNLQGHSFWPLIRGDGYRPRTEIFAEKTFHTAYEPMRAIRTATHKLIVNFEIGLAYDVPADVMQSPIYPLLVPVLVHVRDHVELYDLTSDPWEQSNIAGSADFTDIESELINRLRAWMDETGDPLLNGPVPSPFYDESCRRLAS
jgi:N-sulfoglucosamine sulfohydrolase